MGPNPTCGPISDLPGSRPLEGEHMIIQRLLRGDPRRGGGGGPRDAHGLALRSKQRDPNPKDNSSIERRHLRVRDSTLRLQHRFSMKEFLLGAHGLAPGATQRDPTPSIKSNQLRIGCIKCKHLPNAHNTELIHCKFNLIYLLKLTSGARDGP